MNILMVAGYANSDKHKKLSKYTTGLGVIISSILKELSNYEAVDMFCSMIPICRNIKENRYKIISNLGIISFCDIRQSCRVLRKGNLERKQLNTLKKVLYLLFDFFCICRLNRILRKKQYDIVHIHEASRISYCVSILCEERKIPYLITIHNYYGADSNVKGYQEDKKYGNLILKKKNIYLSTVSSGVKKRIEKDFANIGGYNGIRVILNGSEKSEHMEYYAENILSSYGVDKMKRKIVLCPGTISERKNQIQIVRAFSLLDGDEKSQILIIFMGEDKMNGLLQRTISDYDMEEQLVYIGVVHKNRMPFFYNCADAVISASLNESFGLIFTEGFMCGIPSITYKDLDAISDIFDERVMVTAEERTDRSFMQAIRKWNSEDWDKAYIRDFAERFTIENSVKNYIKYYNDILKQVT